MSLFTELRNFLAESVCNPTETRKECVNAIIIEYKVEEIDAEVWISMMLAEGLIKHRFIDGEQHILVDIGQNYRQKRPGISEGALKRKKVRDFLLDCKAKGIKLDLMNFTYFCRLLTSALSGDMRWKKCASVSREFGFSATGQELPENILEHTGIDTPLLSAMMLAMEKETGTVLDYGTQHLVAVLHDIPEGLTVKGDIDFVLKDLKDEEKEEEEFEFLLSVVSDEVRAYLNKAVLIIAETGRSKRDGTPCNKLSLDAQFFWAVETTGYLSRALYEVKAGNLPFCDPFFTQWLDIQYFRERFVSFRKLIDPHMDFIRKFRKEHENEPWRIKKNS